MLKIFNLHSLRSEFVFTGTQYIYYSKYAWHSTLNLLKLKWRTKTTKVTLHQIPHDFSRYLQVLFLYFKGTKHFFFGDRPSCVDCSVFGQLSQFLWHLPGSEPNAMLKSIRHKIILNWILLLSTTTCIFICHRP